MTLIEAINRFDTLHPNVIPPEEKVRLISLLDGRIKLEIIDTHEGGESVSFTPYEAPQSYNAELLIPYPWDDLYIKYLAAEVDLMSNDTDRYQVSAEVFNDVYNKFRAWYNRTHMPKKINVCYF